MRAFWNRFSVAVLLVELLLTADACAAKVRAWQGAVTIPTYGWADDVNPKLWALERGAKFSITVKGSIVYPYTMQDHLYRTKEDRTYKALFLENEYLKVTCLPELGGRLHSVLDKTEGKEMFHYNDVIKPSMIAMRGAWISGGVEWNAGPQGHTVTILSPVNAIIRRNQDGSACLEISNLEKTLRTRWTVRVTLRPGKAYLDEQVQLFNPTDAVSPYYFWNCAAFANRPGTRFIYPMTLGTDHNAREFFSWPIHEGRDLSWLKNYETYASVFAVDCVYDFFGAYDADADRGIVQVADHRKLGGKKAWTWGTWDFGVVSQKNLADDGSQYIEVQSGPLPTQSDYGMLLPRQEVSWQEWWYPVHGLSDGFEYATKDVAIQSSRERGGLELRMLATSKFPGSVCVVSQGARELVRKRLDLSPYAAQKVTLSPAPASAVDVTIRAKGGNVLAGFTTALPIPETPVPDSARQAQGADEELSAEQKYLKGRKSDLATNRRQARAYYKEALAEDAQYSPALRALAVLDFEAGLYEKAIGQLEAALERDGTDGLGWYFLGASHLRLGNGAESLRCAYKATRCPGTESIGYDLAGRACMRLGDYGKAIEAFGTAVSLNSRDAKAKDHLLLALYAVRDSKAAQKLAAERIRQNPTALVPRAVEALLGKSRMERFAEEVRALAGEDDFEMLETACVFSEVGLAGEAAKLLKAVCVDAVAENQRSPLSMYYLAYLASIQADEAKAKSYLDEAAGIGRDFVFPSRPESAAVLAYAVGENPQDARGHLHLGNLYGHLDRLDEAVRHWRTAGELDSSLSIAFRNLGLHAWVVENDLGKAEQLYRKAIAARPKDQTLYRDLADILLAADNRPEAIKVLESTRFEKTRRADVTIMLAQAYLDEQRYDEAIELLESTPYFVNWEGQTITWDMFNKAHMARGRIRLESKRFKGALEDFEAALTYPENIGVGRSNKPREAPGRYWMGKALEGLGRIEDARSAWKLGAAGQESSTEQNKYRDLCKKALSGPL